MLKYIIAIPLLVILVAFALSNTEIVHLRLWPTDYTLDVALSVAVLVAMGVAFLIGALLLWFAAIGANGRARRAERALARVQAELDRLRAQQAVPSAAPARTSGSTALAMTR
jgi:uncharacterized integral membrane protein